MSFGDSLNLGAGDALQSIKNAAGIVNTARNTSLDRYAYWQSILRPY
jgi:hypothetical protein